MATIKNVKEGKSGAGVSNAGRIGSQKWKTCVYWCIFNRQTVIYE